MRISQRLVTVAITAVALLALASCASPGDNGQADPRLEGQWQLASASDDAGPINLLNQAITLTIDRDTTTSGRSSCSDYRARFLGTSESLWVTATLPHNIDCGSALQQNLEFRYIAALNTVRSAVVTGGDLDLEAPGVDLHFVRALFISMSRIVGHTWVMNSIAPISLEAGQANTAVPLAGATISFDKNGSFTASTVCSTIKGRYFQNAGQVVATHVVVHTGATCTADQAPGDYLVRLIDSSFSFDSAVKGELKLISPRAEITLGFLESIPTGE